jgi:hypothetical protein
MNFVKTLRAINNNDETGRLAFVLTACTIGSLIKLTPPTGLSKGDRRTALQTLGEESFSAVMWIKTGKGEEKVSIAGNKKFQIGMSVFGGIMIMGFTPLVHGLLKKPIDRFLAQFDPEETPAALSASTSGFADKIQTERQQATQAGTSPGKA